jgi:hypothetical protein
MTTSSSILNSADLVAARRIGSALGITLTQQSNEMFKNLLTQYLEQIADALESGSLVTAYTDNNATLAIGEQDIVHNLGRAPKAVFAYDNITNQAVELDWREKTGAETTTIVVDSFETYSDLNINVI